MNKTIKVVNLNGGWVVQVGAMQLKFTRRFDAVQKARELGLARNWSVHIHNPSGVFVDRDVVKPASAEHFKKVMRESMASS